MRNDVALGLWREARAAIAGERRQRGEASVAPVERYLDPALAARELAMVRRHPIAVVASASLAADGAWLSTRVHGVPILLARDAAGVLHAHLNVCRHRGAIVAPEESGGVGKARFVCPYHAWTYDAGGRQVGRPWQDEFPQVACAEDADLVAVPVAERLGLVWVVPTGRMAFDWDAWFGPFGEELAGLGYDAAAISPHARRFEQKSNWKLVLEGNLETYHFQYAHRTTIAPLFHDNVIVHAQEGDHQRIVLPKRSLATVEVTDDAVDGPLLGRHSNVIWFFFPCTFLLWEGDHLDGFSVSPAGAETCDVRGWMVVPERYAGKPAAHWAENDGIFWEALGEDFGLAASIQTGLESGANAGLRYGASEFACGLFSLSLQATMAERTSSRRATRPPVAACRRRGGDPRSRCTHPTPDPSGSD